MSLLRATSAILSNNLLRLLRDRFLLGAAGYIAGCAVALRWLVPWLRGALLAESGVDITPYVALGVSYFALVNASVLTGMLGGFLLLETREERALSALLVTPTPLALHLAALGAAIVAAGVALSLGLAWLVGLGAPGGAALWVSALLGAPTGVVMALILATVASNKVEAFAVMKLTAILGLLPVAGFFLPAPLQVLVGVAPPYWACKSWWMAAAGEPDWGWLVAPGVAVSLGWIGWLVVRFQRVARG